MSISKLLIATLVGTALGILPYWFFGGILFHEKYGVYPEVWRRLEGGARENRASALSVLFSLLTFF